LSEPNQDVNDSKVSKPVPLLTESLRYKHYVTLLVDLLGSAFQMWLEILCVQCHVTVMPLGNMTATQDMGVCAVI